MSIPKTQTGYGFLRGSKSINRFDNLPVPEPGPGEILLKIEAAGLCRSDHHILISQNPGCPDKMVMGHEICGSVAKTGSGLENDPRYKPGTRYAMLISNSCGTCSKCREGSDNLCTTNKNQGYGITMDGGFQEYLLVSSLRTLIPIPDSVSYGAAASATDAILTPFHAIKKVKEYLTPTSKVLVLGAGGLGLNAIQILRSFGCKIVCVDQKPGNEKLVKQFGAHEFYLSFDEIDHEEESFDVTFDFVGNQDSVDCSCDFVAGGGKIVIVGMGKSRVDLPIFDLSRREIQVIYNFGGNSSEQKEVLRWIGNGLITPVVESRPMTELSDYMEKMKRGEIVGRVVFKPVAKL